MCDQQLLSVTNAFRHVIDPHIASALYLVMMKRSWLLDNFLVRNLLGLLALIGAHYLSDLYTIDQRPGFSKISPYLYLISLYGWLVFHNRILFERLLMRGKRAYYFACFALCMAMGSFNMNLILHNDFAVTHTLPFLVNFWVYTIAGIGVYITYRQLYSSPKEPVSMLLPEPLLSKESGSFSCMVDGVRLEIAHADIQYVESLENYVKVITDKKTYVTRLTLKEAEERLPKPPFVRISRSYIVNAIHINNKEPDSVWIGSKELRIGKVYKRYVSEQFASE